jgi:hypothetical protein
MRLMATVPKHVTVRYAEADYWEGKKAGASKLLGQTWSVRQGGSLLFCCCP